MQTIYFNNIGDPKEVLEIGNIMNLEPNENEVRIKVLASPINPADILFVNGVYRIKPILPQIAGLEGVGIVDKVGKNVSIPLKSLVSFRYKGAWAEYTIIPLEKIIKLPKDFPIEKASQFSLNPVTAYGLLDESKAHAGDWILLTAGNSAISKMIIQMAKIREINTIAFIRNKRDIDKLKNIGANKVLIDSDNDIVQSVLRITNNQGVKCILDSVGGPLISDLLKSIAPLGQLITYGLLSNNNVEFHNSTIIFKNITIKGFGIDNWLLRINNKEKKTMLDWLINTLSNNQFEMPIVAKFTIKDFQKAIEMYQERKIKGKILLTME